jgi:hypothetical protein
MRQESNRTSEAALAPSPGGIAAGGLAATGAFVRHHEEPPSPAH